MTKLTTTIFCVLTLICCQTQGQTFRQQFNELVSKNDTVKQVALLGKWEKSNSNDPELYVAYFNFYVNKSTKEMVALGNNPKGKDALEIKNDDSKKGGTVGFIYDDTHYDTNLLNKGFQYIDKGIEKFPNRLDMRFGKIFMFGKTENYEKFTTEIIKTVEYSDVNKNFWTWTDNKPQDNPKDFMLSSIQSYQLQLYNTEKDELLDNMKRIAETILKYYPNHIESLSNISIVFMLQKQYDRAIEPLLKAEKLNPKDFIVLGNIAQAYKLKGDNKNAIKYYELTEKWGDEQSKRYAKGQIKALTAK